MGWQRGDILAVYKTMTGVRRASKGWLFIVSIHELVSKEGNMWQVKTKK